MSNIDTSLITLARTLSKTFHQNQLYGTYNYFDYHIENGVVALLKLHNFSENYIIVGYLHDLIEDVDTVSINTIKELFGNVISEAVDAITKRSNETREEYLTRCSKNKIARIVKLQDAVFNATNCAKNKNKNKYHYYLNTISYLTIES